MRRRRADEDRFPLRTPSERQLARILFERGGDSVMIRSPNPDYSDLELLPAWIQALVSQGAWYDRFPRSIRPGQPNDCHGNALLFAFGHPGYQWIMGFALGRDLLWRPHSWCFSAESRRLIETTAGFDRYFGADPRLVGFRTMKRDLKKSPLVCQLLGEVASSSVRSEASQR